MRALNADPEFRAANAGRMRALNAARRGFAIPAWVDAAGLRDDYMDAAAEHGEEHAASVCRALKRQAQEDAGTRSQRAPAVVTKSSQSSVAPHGETMEGIQ